MTWERREWSEEREKIERREDIIENEFERNRTPRNSMEIRENREQKVTHPLYDYFVASRVHFWIVNFHPSK